MYFEVLFVGHKDNDYFYNDGYLFSSFLYFFALFYFLKVFSYFCKQFLTNKILCEV